MSNSSFESIINYFTDAKFSSCSIMDTVVHIDQGKELLNIDLSLPHMNGRLSIDYPSTELYSLCRITEGLALTIEATPAFINRNHSFLITPIAKIIKNNNDEVIITNSYIASKLIFEIQLTFNKGMNIDTFNDYFIKGDK